LKYTEAGSTIHSEPAEKGRKKKQKNPGINPRQPAKKGRGKKEKKKKKKKNCGITLGSAI
jgi:hypothetical protein